MDNKSNQITIHKLFEEAALHFPENTAILEGPRNVTYRTLDMAANRIANTLKENNIGAGKIVGIYLDASIEYIVAVLGVLKSGAIFMPINTQYPIKRLGYVIDKTKPEIIITGIFLESELSQKLLKLRPPSRARYMLVFESEVYFNWKPHPAGTPMDYGSELIENISNNTTELDDGCYIITTSGSTGEPKAILGSHIGLTHFIRWEIEEFNLNEKEQVTLLSAVTFDVSLRDIFIPLSVGGTLCIPDEETRYNPKRMVTWLKKTGITVSHMVPTLFRLITRELENLDRSEEFLPKLKYVLIAGETLYGSDVINWRKAVKNKIELINVYGPSETTLAKLFYRITDSSFSPTESVPIGKPIPGAEVLIVNDGKLCPVGDVGEIFIKTAFMTKGYFNDPNSNEISFVQNPLVADYKDIVYRTGDFGELLPDGNVRFLGRRDGQIKHLGIRIETGEVEVVLRQHPQVKEAVITAKKDVSGNQRLVGYIIPKSAEKIAVESLHRFVRERLPDSMIPAVYLTIKELPLTHSGKIDRMALPEPGSSRPEMEEPYVPPSTGLEISITKIWCQVLNLDRVGVNDNFFDLGGTSLLSVYLTELINKNLGTNLLVIKLFQYPKIRLLAAYLNQTQNVKFPDEKIKSRAQQRREAFFRQRRFKGKL